MPHQHIELCLQRRYTAIGTIISIEAPFLVFQVV